MSFKVVITNNNDNNNINNDDNNNNNNNNNNRLQQLDVEFMKRIHNKVNIVPIIAKADTLTAQELERLKIKVVVMMMMMMMMMMMEEEEVMMVTSTTMMMVIFVDGEGDDDDGPLIRFWRTWRDTRSRFTSSLSAIAMKMRK